MESTCLTLTAGSPGPAARSVSPATGRLVHSDEIHMALLQLWEDSFVEGQCPNCDDHVHSARSVLSGKMMPFDNPLTVVRTETLTSTRPSTRAFAVRRVNETLEMSVPHSRECGAQTNTL